MDNKLLGYYKNGNYSVFIMKDGTKIRKSPTDQFLPEKPESMDLLITKKCECNCAFCHEAATPGGKNGDILNAPFLDTLLPYTEIAIGGGDTFLHPDLVPFLKKCKERKLICNTTVHQTQFIKYQKEIRELTDAGLLYGIGVSLFAPTDNLISLIKQYPNAVVHVINGVQPLSVLKDLYDKDLKLLILGYKEFRRGKDYYSPEVEAAKKEMYDALPDLVKHFKVVSFDNLAIKQLDVKRIVPDWDRFYMGDDGQFTMYIDLGNRHFAKCSIAPLNERYPLTNDIKDMFAKIRASSKQIPFDCQLGIKVTFYQNQ